MRVVAAIISSISVKVVKRATYRSVLIAEKNIYRQESST